MSNLKTCTNMFRAAFYTIGKILKQPGYQQMNGYITCGIVYLEIKRKSALLKYTNNMDDLKNVILNQGRLTRVYAT